MNFIKNYFADWNAWEKSWVIIASAVGIWLGLQWGAGGWKTALSIFTCLTGIWCVILVANWLAGKVVPESTEEPISVANLPSAFIITPEKAKRMIVLLAAAAQLIEQCEDGPYVKNAPAEEIFTKDYEGDGHSLMNDIKDILE